MLIYKNLIYRLTGLLIISSIFFLNYCSSDPTEPADNEKMNLTGSWEMTVTISSNSCGLQSGETNVEIIDLTDNNGALSIVNFNGLWGNGQFDGLRSLSQVQKPQMILVA